MNSKRLWIGAITMIVVGCWLKNASQCMVGLGLCYMAWASMDDGKAEYELDLENGHIKRLVDAYEIKGDVAGFLLNLFKDIEVKKIK